MNRYELGASKNDHSHDLKIGVTAGICMFFNLVITNNKINIPANDMLNKITKIILIYDWLVNVKLALAISCQ